MFLTKLNEVLTSEKSFIKERLNAAGFGISLLINIIHWLILYIKIGVTQENILIHYNVLVGNQFVGPGYLAYMIPSLALLALFMNAVLANLYHRKEKLTAYFLAIATIVVQIIFLIGSIVLIAAND